MNVDSGLDPAREFGSRQFPRARRVSIPLLCAQAVGRGLAAAADVGECPGQVIHLLIDRRFGGLHGYKFIGQLGLIRLDLRFDAADLRIDVRRLLGQACLMRNQRTVVANRPRQKRLKLDGQAAR